MAVDTIVFMYCGINSSRFPSLYSFCSAAFFILKVTYMCLCMCVCVIQMPKHLSSFFGLLLVGGGGGGGSILAVLGE